MTDYKPLNEPASAFTAHDGMSYVVCRPTDGGVSAIVYSEPGGGVAVAHSPLLDSVEMARQWAKDKIGELRNFR